MKWSPPVNLFKERGTPVIMEPLSSYKTLIQWPDSTFLEYYIIILE
jgi:hypothetical protein